MTENAYLRALLIRDAARIRAETEQQMQPLQGGHASACSADRDSELIKRSESYLTSSGPPDASRRA